MREIKFTEEEQAILERNLALHDCERCRDFTPAEAELVRQQLAARQQYDEAVERRPR